MPAFQRAVELGYEYVETDVRTTADGVLLAFHDAELDRVTNRHGRVRELPYADVAAARIRDREPIPRLEDLLGTWPHIRVNIDLKEAGTLAPLVRALRRTGAAHRVCVASFVGRRVSAARHVLGSRVCSAAGPAEAVALWLAATAGTPWWMTRPGFGCAQLPSHAYGVPVITPALVHFAHEQGVQVHAWTINEPAEMHRLLDMDIDGIVTDQPATLRDVLAGRNQWFSGRR